jgi:uncharacterized protein YdhG (YjbR/CyaY superfamily)
MKEQISVDDYIAGFPEDVRPLLEAIRSVVKNAAPEAEETFSYGIPAFKLHQTILVYFAGFKNHIGFYPTPSGISEFKNEFAAYPSGKGSVQFPLDKPLPLDLIRKTVQFRVKESAQKATKKK